MAAYLRAADHLPPRFNGAEWFIGRHIREGRESSIAIIDDSGSLTYGELDDAVRRFAERSTKFWKTSPRSNTT